MSNGHISNLTIASYDSKLYMGRKGEERGGWELRLLEMLDFYWV